MASFDELGIDVRPGGGINQKVECPVCKGDHRKKDKSLSINTSNGFYNCHRCGWKGKAGDKKETITKREYDRPKKIELPLSEAAIDWFFKRGITRETLQYFKVSESKEKMYAAGNHPEEVRTCINFNYYRNQEKINIKFRDALKCFKMSYNAELILYNLDALKDATDMLICEGEIDCMTFYQGGHYRAVSVPNGASKGSAKLEYLDNCADVFDRMEKIIIAVDGDEAGEFLKNELVRRLGAHRCWLVTYPEGCKDANEVWLKHGEAGVRELWKKATPPKLESVLTVEDVQDQLADIYTNGWPQNEPVGHAGFDKLLNFEPGQITMVTGIPGHGKDEFLIDIMVRKAARYGESIGVFNYEEPAHIITIKAAQKYIGKPFYRADKLVMMNLAQRDAALKFINEHFFFIDIDTANLTVEGVIAKGTELVLRKNIKHFIVGPWNCFEHNRGDNQTEGEYIGESLSKFKRFARKCGVHVYIVAHPTKIYKDKSSPPKYEVPTLYQIAGSANFFNKPDNGITVYRNYSDNTTDVHVQKVKFFYNGKLGLQTFDFDVDTGRYAEIGAPFQSQYDYRAESEVKTTVEEAPLFEKWVSKFPPTPTENWYDPKTEDVF